MKPCAVLLMVRSLGPGGTERQVVEFAKFIDRAQFEPHVGYFDEGFRMAELHAAGVPLLKMTMRGFLTLDSPRCLYALARYVRSHRVRLVHSFDHPMNIFGVPAARLLKVPAVLASQRSHRDGIPVKYRPLIRFSDRMADGIVVNCEAVRRHLMADYHVPDARIHICYNTVDTLHFRPASRRRPPELASARLVIGVICVWRAVKNLSTLLDAFAAVLARFPGLQLLIVGDGPESDRLIHQAARLGLGDACVFRPSTSDVLPWLHAIDVFVLPSLSEALSNSLLEAMAAGCCVVASRVGGNPELVRHEETGLLFESRDANDLARQLTRLVEDDALRKRLSDVAARWVADAFCPARSVSRLEEIYRQFIDAAETR